MTTSEKIPKKVAGGLKILLVEDHPTWQNILKKEIKHAIKPFDSKCLIEVFSDFDQADKALDSEGPWDLMVTDIGLGSPESRQKLGKILVESACRLDVPTIVVSGTPVLTPKDIRDLLKVYRAYDFFSKQHFDGDTFILRIQEILEKKSKSHEDISAKDQTIHRGGTSFQGEASLNTKTRPSNRNDGGELNIPTELLFELNRGNIVLFCGAGISVSDGGLPDGNQLAQELAERADLDDMAGKKLSEVAEAYKHKMGHHSLVNYIANRIDNLNLVPLPVHQLIVERRFKKVITTSWDNLLEDAFRQLHQGYIKVVSDNDLGYVDDEKVQLIKLHGSIEQKDSLIITGDDYYDVFARLPETANLVRTFFATRTVLFLGFGLADEDFNRLYHEVIRYLGQHKSRAYAVQLDPTPFTIGYWEKKNVQIIPADVTSFLSELKVQLQTADAR